MLVDFWCAGADRLTVGSHSSIALKRGTSGGLSEIYFALKRGTSGGLSEIYLSVCLSVCVCVCRQSRKSSHEINVQCRHQGCRRRRGAVVIAVNRTVSTAACDRAHAGYEEAVEEVMGEANKHLEHFKRSFECKEFSSYLPKKIAEE